MSDKNSKKSGKPNLATKHDKWAQEAAKIRKVQISLDFPDAADVLLRTLAAREHKAPSSMVREIVGLPSSPPKRARIGVSFNDQELKQLGKRYGISPDNKAEIRRKLTEEVTSVLIVTEGGDAVDTGSSAYGGSKSKSKAGKSNATMSAPADDFAMNELKNVADGIHQRFQQALAKRNFDKE